MSEADRNSKAKTLDEKKKQLDRDSADARDAFQQDMQDMYQGLASKVYDVMQSYADLQGFTLVLDVSAQATPVLYSANGTDITKAVVDAYNLKSGVPAPPANPPPKRPSRQLPGQQRPGSPQRTKQNRSRIAAKAPLAGAFALRAASTPPSSCGKICGFLSESLAESPIFSSCQPPSDSDKRSNSFYFNKNVSQIAAHAARHLPIVRTIASRRTFPQSVVKIYSQRPADS